MSENSPQADSQLAKLFHLQRSHVDRTLAHIMQRDLDYADLYFQSSNKEVWLLEESQVKPGYFGLDQGVGIRAIVGEKTAFAYTNELTPTSLLQCADTVRAITRSGQQASIGLSSTPQPRAAHQLYLNHNPILSFAESEKVMLLEKVDRLARARNPLVKSVSASLSASYEEVVIARHDGKIDTDSRPITQLMIRVIAEKNGRQESGIAGGGSRLDYRSIDDETLCRWVNQAVDQALVNLEAIETHAGTMSVVLAAGWPGVFLHEAVGHGLEGDFNRKGSSAFSGRLGERVAAKGVTVVDDGALVNRRGSMNVDDEGTTTGSTTLIEDGVLTGYMQDSLNARLMGMPLTGNARRAAYSSLPLPRMTNTFLCAGQYQPEEIITSVKKGIYAVSFNGGQVDISSGKYVFTATEAYLIENGKITHPIKGATLIGDGPSAMSQVSMIGNDLAHDQGNGMCSKEGQTLAVSVGQPTLRIDNITVGGTA